METLQNPQSRHVPYRYDVSKTVKQNKYIQMMSLKNILYYSQMFVLCRDLTDAQRAQSTLMTVEKSLGGG